MPLLPHSSGGEVAQFGVPTPAHCRPRAAMMLGEPAWHRRQRAAMGFCARPSSHSRRRWWAAGPLLAPEVGRASARPWIGATGAMRGCALLA